MKTSALVEAHGLAEGLGELQEQLVHRDGSGQPAPERPENLVRCLARAVDEPRRRCEETLAHGYEDERGHARGDHGQGEDLLVTGGLGCVPEAEHHDEVDGRDHHDEAEHRQDLDEPRLACGPSVLFSPAKRPSGTSTVAPAATAPSAPGQPTSRCSTVATRRHRRRQAHSDPEPLHPLAVMSDGPDVARPHRCDRQHARDGPADGAVHDGEGLMIDDEPDPDATAAT